MVEKRGQLRGSWWWSPQDELDTRREKREKKRKEGNCLWALLMRLESMMGLVVHEKVRVGAREKLGVLFGPGYA